MTDFSAVFSAAHPQAFDFVKTEYDANKDAIDAAAARNGYRLAGERLGFVVFTTKPKKEVALDRK